MCIRSIPDFNKQVVVNIINQEQIIIPLDEVRKHALKCANLSLCPTLMDKGIVEVGSVQFKLLE